MKDLLWSLSLQIPNHHSLLVGNSLSNFLRPVSLYYSWTPRSNLSNFSNSIHTPNEIKAYCMKEFRIAKKTDFAKLTLIAIDNFASHPVSWLRILTIINWYVMLGTLLWKSLTHWNPHMLLIESATRTSAFSEKYNLVLSTKFYRISITILACSMSIPQNNTSSSTKVDLIQSYWTLFFIRDHLINTMIKSFHTKHK